MTADLQPLLGAYAEALSSFHDLAADLDEADWSRPTDCPGWTVREQVAHVVAVEEQLAGHPLPPRLSTYPPHVRNPVGEHMESGVAALADLAPDEVVKRLGAAVDEHLAQLRSVDLVQDSSVLGVMGTPVPLPRFLPIRSLDVWTHEQDVRRATGRPGGLSGPAAEASVGQILAALPYVLGELAPPGSSVAVVVDGEVPVATTVTVAADGTASSAEGVAEDATVTLRMSTETLGRLAGGRVEAAAAAVDVGGDEQLGRTLLAGLAISP